MSVYLALGSNLGDRRAALEHALGRLGSHGIELERVSPVVETPALLPDDAPAEWNRPFLNVVARCATHLTPTATLAAAKAIEGALGRADPRKWSPRPIDVDLLLFGNEVIRTDELVVPHAELHRREFVLTPLAALEPGLVIPGAGKTALALSRELGRNVPLWMGIVNVTPDSFSDGGRHVQWSAIEPVVDSMTAAGVHAIDFGAESTRPGAVPLTAKEELERLAPVLDAAIDKFSGRLIRPAISVDTYHVETARFVIEHGADVVNDVGGLTDPAMIELAATSAAVWIAMHQVSIPADPKRTLDTDRSAVDQVVAWLEDRLGVWSAAGLPADRVIFDPGIGFGKTPLQSLDLLRHIDKFVRADVRLLVGHSRKSFMRSVAGDDMRARDMVTIGASMDLGARGVDMLRVHNVPDHLNAYRGWAHMQP